MGNKRVDAYDLIDALADDDQGLIWDTSSSSVKNYTPSQVSSYVNSKLPTVTVGVAGSGATYETDGTADQTQINAAITAVNAAGGGIVQLQDGQFDITGLITMKSNVTLQGVGWSTVLKRNASMTVDRVIYATGIDNASVKNLKIDGSNDLVIPADNMESLRIDSSTNIFIDRVFVLNSPSEGIQLHIADSSRITHCRAEGTAMISGSYKAGIILSGSSDVAQSKNSSIENCYTLNTSGEGVGLYYANGCKLIGNTTDWTSGASNRGQIQLEQSENGTVVGNTVTSNYFGIVNLSSDRMTISANVVMASTENGVIVQGSSRDVTIADNIFQNIDKHGILLQDTARNITVSGNKIVDAGILTDATYDAIHLDPNGGYVRRVTITGNHVYAKNANKINSFLGTTTDTSNRVVNLIEKDNHSEGHLAEFRTIDDLVFCSFKDNEFIVATDGSGDYNCDGTDDEVQIQAAIDAVKAAGGGTVRLAVGTYQLSTPLVIDALVNLIGEGRRTVLNVTSAINAIELFADTGSIIGETISNLRISGDGSTALKGIYLKASSSFEHTALSLNNLDINGFVHQIYADCPVGGSLNDVILEYGYGDNIGLKCAQTGTETIKLVLNRCHLEGLTTGVDLVGRSYLTFVGVEVNNTTNTYLMANSGTDYPELAMLGEPGNQAHLIDYNTAVSRIHTYDSSNGVGELRFAKGLAGGSSRTGLRFDAATDTTSLYDFQNSESRLTYTNTGVVTVPGTIVGNGGYISKTSGYTLLRASDRGGVVDFTGATTANATLPTSGNVTGDTYTIKNSGTGTITVVGTIDGATNYSLNTQYMRVTVVYNGTDWSIIN